MQTEPSLSKANGALSLLPLRRIRLELLLDCPLHCIHCSAHAAPHHPLAMTTDLAFRLIEEVAQIGGEEITFTGGEPLVDPRLPALLGRATGLGMSTVVFTSGIVYGADGPHSISMEESSRLAGLLSRVVVSVYSVDASIHDTITQSKCSLAWTQQAICRFLAQGIRVEMHFVATSMNYRELPTLVSQAVNLGVCTIRVIRYVPQGRGRAQQDRLRLNTEQQSEFRAILNMVRQNPDIAVKIGSGFGYLLSDAPACTAAVEEIVVGADGRVYPCSGFAGIHGPPTLGNVLEMPLSTIWESSPYLRTVREMALAQRSKACHLGCPAQMAATGDPSWASATDPDATALRPLEGSALALKK